MGHPKKQKKKYETPLRPYDRARLEKERKIAREFGLRRKREIWKAESILRNFRRRARELQARRDEEEELTLFRKLQGMGIRCSSLEEVLEIQLENMLCRRLQTVVHKKGMANTPRQARQLIVHGHVSVGGRRVLWPSYIVQKGEEDSISLDTKVSAAIAKEDEK